MHPSDREKQKEFMRRFGMPLINFYFHGACEGRLAELLRRRSEVEIPRSRKSWKPPELVGRWRDITKCDLCGVAFDKADAADYVSVSATRPETLELWREAEAEDPRPAPAPAPADARAPSAPVASAGESPRQPAAPFLSGSWPDAAAMLAVFINAAFKGALAAGASQILLEADPVDEVVLITYRVGGCLRPGPFKLARSHRAALVSRLKVMTGTMNAMERQVAQRGTIIILSAGKEVRWLVETSPSPAGESVTLTLTQEGG